MKLAKLTTLALLALSAVSFAASAVSFAAEPADTPKPIDPKLLDGKEGRPLALDQFFPEPRLRVPQTSLARAKFPVIDIHTHFKLKTNQSKQALDDFVQLMDRQGIALCMSLDGGIGDALTEHQRYLAPHAERFGVLVNVDFRGSGKPNDPASWDCHRPDFGRHVSEQLRQAKESGALGVKFFKSFGLEYRNPDGSLIAVDDPRWDPIWKTCGELEMPVLIHTADPSAFFEPIDGKNERWEELHRRPEWSFPPDKFPAREKLHAARNRVVERFPKTRFIAAHLGNDGEDLAQLSQWLDKYPNLYVDIASRISELGRQPYSARKFIIKYSDRVLFGTDGPWPEARISLYWRHLETWDENFPYSEKPFPPQGYWRIYGIGLPDEVLQKVYFENALQVFPGLKARYEKAAAKLGIRKPANP